MKKIAIVILAISFIGMCFSSCTPDNNKQASYVFPQYSKAFNYNVGNYWVYYDSLNNSYDSLIVTGKEHFPPFSTSSTIRFESYNISMLFHDSDTTKYLSIQLQLTAPYALGVNYTYADSSTSIEYPYPADLMVKVPFDTGTIKVDNGDFIGFCKRNFIGQLTIDGKSYSNVYRVEYTNNHLGITEVFYISTDVGFVEMLFNNAHFHRKLYLIRYNR